MPSIVQLQSRRARPSAAEELGLRIVRERLSRGDQVKFLRKVIVRFGEAMSPRANVDHVCRVHVTLAQVSDVPSFIVEGRAPTDRVAAELAADAAMRAIEQTLADSDRMKGRKPKRSAQSVPLPASFRVTLEAIDESESEEEIRLQRMNRDTTPRAVKSARPARGTHVHKTQNQARATVAREAFTTRPSRKSTRKSANRVKSDNAVRKRTSRGIRQAA